MMPSNLEDQTTALSKNKFQNRRERLHKLSSLCPVVSIAVIVNDQ